MRRWLVCGVLLIQSWLAGQPVWAADPFREGEAARPMSAAMATAFERFFCAGDYVESRGLLLEAQQVEPQEPLTYALLAALAYLDGDYDGFARLATQTREVASALVATDPLRGHLYKGVGYGMEAATIVIREGVAVGLPRALPTLNSLFGAITAANAVDETDPELNLLNGYMDLLLTRRERALTQFDLAGPDYLALRGQALTLRDLRRYEEALERVDLAIANACENPELFYLKAQILQGLGETQASIEYFDQALALAEQLPAGLVEQITVERTNALASLGQ